MAPKEKKESAHNDFDDIRQYSITLLTNQNSKIKKDIILKLEDGIFNSSKNEIMTYTILLIKIIENLKIPHVQEQLKNGIWKPEDVATLEKDTLNPDKWQQIQDARLPKNIKKERKKGLYKCPRCRSFYCTYTQSQTRSADEGLTTRNECQDCGFVWKF